MAYKYSYDAYDDEVREYKPAPLKTDRCMWKLVLFSILTLGIYSIIFFIPFSFDLNKITPRREKEKTMNYLWAYLLAYFTVALVLMVWHYQVAHHVEEALKRRDIPYHFGTETFWLWMVAGSFFLIGPFIYFHKLCQAMNLLCEHYNADPLAQY